jgi:hypothetical protein
MQRNALDPYKDPCVPPLFCFNYTAPRPSGNDGASVNRRDTGNGRLGGGSGGGGLPLRLASSLPSSTHLPPLYLVMYSSRFDQMFLNALLITQKMGYVPNVIGLTEYYGFTYRSVKHMNEFKIHSLLQVRNNFLVYIMYCIIWTNKTRNYQMNRTGERADGSTKPPFFLSSPLLSF